MKKLLLILFTGVVIAGSAQTSPILSSWIRNTTGKKGSFWAPNGNPPNITYSFTTSADSADVESVCYTTDSVWIRCDGLTSNMGKYMNPGSCLAQNYVFKFPRNPVVATTKVTSPVVNAIGVLLNGVPIYGLTNASSWNGTTNANNGGNVWHVEVYLSEGFVLDTAFGAHPQQQGAYHSHATPWRFYRTFSPTVHSPLVGFAFDGYPVYGPYGYSTPTSSSSAVARMKTGYSLRNITTRTILPDGSTASQTGPPVSSTYPLGTYMEDYAWAAANNGDLDEYNGRYCVTPEYPNGTYAYFVTQDAAGTPQFPYYIGFKYYGKPETGNYTIGVKFKIPTAANCSNTSTTTVGMSEAAIENELLIYPNPANGAFHVMADYVTNDMSEIKVMNMTGQTVYTAPLFYGDNLVSLPPDAAKGIYLLHAISKTGKVTFTKKIVVE